ncbi:PEDO-3 family subclass B1 metallo-beta-lactamase [Pedobacter fastidiosus]|uniref:beta-lactamase n=1 Tax=Pedobacter fastidiosus TaxID=2765361 RepID=A0ABR7KLZ8_9SPHI|nr:PEDO-3 family subclass B1 metallo-beta-lactamase [Pedobacter fastidiosus]MBC6108999.1 PEDO-3 family subclass B1 metallo-beta-lactamase [Pedobacter fastidiosus]
MRYLFSITLSFIFSVALGQNPKIKIKHLTGNLYSYTTYHDYKGTITDANSVYLVTSKGVVVVDAPWDSAQFQPFLDSIETKHHKKVILDIATHSHEDRAGGLAFFKAKGIKTYTSKKTDQILKTEKLERPQFTFSNDTTFVVDGYKINTFFAGEGHTKDNIVIWFEKDKVLFGGCLVKSTEAKDLGYIVEANLAQWPTAIKNLKQKYPDAKIVVTGHQAWAGKESLDYTLKLLSEKK